MSESQVHDSSEEIDGSTADEVLLHIPPEPTYISMARMFAASVARHFGCEEDTVDDVKIAISETVTNAVKAHQSGDVVVPVLLRVIRTEKSLTFDVVDAGAGFDFKPEMTTTQPAVLRRGSLGLALVRSIFPSTHVDRNPDRGMTVGFTVDLTSA